ncbi:MAG: winged helix-turn-helix transcriptional regulator [Rhodopirellula sp.]|nr:winged helix-turn-helix transcriptional regulator [Rhodopirellula sp.]
MPKSQLDLPWSEQAQWLRAMAHPVRLIVLEALCERPRCVKDINSLVPIVQAHLSQHIAALRKAKLIDCHINGALRCYYVARPTLVKRMIRLLSQEHPTRSRDCRSVLREARNDGAGSRAARQQE